MKPPHRSASGLRDVTTGPVQCTRAVGGCMSIFTSSRRQIRHISRSAPACGVRCCPECSDGHLDRTGTAIHCQSKDRGWPPSRNSDGRGPIVRAGLVRLLTRTHTSGKANTSGSPPTLSSSNLRVAWFANCSTTGSVKCRFWFSQDQSASLPRSLPRPAAVRFAVKDIGQRLMKQGRSRLIENQILI